MVVVARKAKAAIAAVAGFTPSPRADAGAARKILAQVFEAMSPMPGQTRRRRDRFAIGSKKSDCSKSGLRRRMSRKVSESQEYLHTPHHGRARIAALSLCNDGSKRRKCPCARMRTPCLIDLKYCYISTPARDGADRREESVGHCALPCTVRAGRAVEQCLDHPEERGQSRGSTKRGERPARPVQAEQWQGASIN
jgi:hypothetical protein